MIITVKGVNITVGRDANEAKAAAEFVHHLLHLDKEAKLYSEAWGTNVITRIGASTPS